MEAEKKFSSEEPRRKRSKQSTITERINDRALEESFARHWARREPLETPELCLITEPYRLCKISNFISCPKFMEDAKAELADVKSRRQSTDLYQFEQTSDLADVRTTNLTRLRRTFRSEFADWVARNTGIELNGKMSMSSSVYYDTDYLLCHDDNMGDRRIAFVLYLSKDWTPEDGGSLDLYDTDENGAPGKITRSLFPEYNSLIFFEVHDDSYHRVGEVKSAEKSRWTINGWFHGPIVESRKKPRPEVRPVSHSPENSPAVRLPDWIKNCYLESSVAQSVQKNVEADSYAFLSNFFINEMYEILANQVASEKIVWTRVGPPDVRNYEIAREESLPEELGKFYRIFRNIEFFRLLKAYTELDLVPSIGDGTDPRMSLELQRWSNGCYTLMYDRSGENLVEKGGSRSEDDVFAINGEEETFEENGKSILRNDIPRDRGDNSQNQRDRIGPDCSEKLVKSPSASGTDESGDSVVLKRLLRNKTRAEKKSVSQQILQQASCSSIENKSVNNFDPESSDSDVSDIGDYLSDRFERSIENSDDDDDDNEEEEDDDRRCATSPSICEPGSLDVILQFNTGQVPSDETIDYIDPDQQEGALIHVPFRDNHLCLAYKTLRTTRLHKYVNHYCKGYFYNLVCTYYE